MAGAEELLEVCRRTIQRDIDFMRDRLLLRRMGRSHEEYLAADGRQAFREGDERPVQRSLHFVQSNIG
jgi:hypothetical protein